VALAWLLRQPGVTSPIIGATRVEQIDDLVAALRVQLDQEACAYLEQRYRPRPILGHE